MLCVVQCVEIHQPSVWRSADPLIGDLLCDEPKCNPNTSVRKNILIFPFRYEDGLSTTDSYVQSMIQVLKGL